MITTDQLQTLLSSGGTVVGDGGDKIGKVGQVFLDDETGEPEWVTAKTGLFGGAETFIPLAQASAAGDEIRVPYSKDKVKDAPRIDDAGGHLTQQQEADLYRYYGLDYSETSSDSGLPDGVATPSSGGGQRRDRSDESGVVGRDTSGPTTDDAMTRSEEQLRVGTETVQSGKARLRKFITTENVTQTVPVSHEEVRLEREPITDANRGDAMAGGDITEEEHEVVLTEERAVVTKETVPVERFRLDRETVTDTEQVSGEVRKEQIELDTPDTTRRNTDKR